MRTRARDVRVGQRVGVQAARFGAEHQHVARLVGHVGERRRRMRGERVDPYRREGVPRGGQIRVHGDRRQVVVVQAGPAQFGFRQVESEWLDQMQFAARCRDHADRIAGVGRDARRVEHHLEQNRESSPSYGDYLEQ